MVKNRMKADALIELQALHRILSMLSYINSQTLYMMAVDLTGLHVVLGKINIYNYQQ